MDSWTVVNNGRADEACSLAASYGARILRSPKNIGFGAAHNMAVRQYLEYTDYHVIINPDIQFETGVLARLLSFMQHHRDVGLVMPRILNSDGTEQNLCKLLPAPMDLVARRFFGKVGEWLLSRRLNAYNMGGMDMTVAREVPCLSGCFMFLRGNALRKVGLFDDQFFMYMEDVDLCRRISTEYRLVFHPGVFVFHGYARGSYNNWKLLGYHLRSAIRYFNKWGWLADPLRSNLNQRVAPVELSIDGGDKFLEPG